MINLSFYENLNWKLIWLELIRELEIYEISWSFKLYKLKWDKKFLWFLTKFSYSWKPSVFPKQIHSIKKKTKQRVFYSTSWFHSTFSCNEYYFSGLLGQEILYYCFMDRDGYYLDGAWRPEILYHFLLDHDEYCHQFLGCDGHFHFSKIMICDSLCYFNRDGYYHFSNHSLSCDGITLYM